MSLTFNLLQDAADRDTARHISQSGTRHRRGLAARAEIRAAAVEFRKQGSPGHCAAPHTAYLSLAYAVLHMALEPILRRQNTIVHIEFVKWCAHQSSEGGRHTTFGVDKRCLLSLEAVEGFVRCCR